VTIGPAAVKIACRLLFRQWTKTKNSSSLVRRRHQYVAQRNCGTLSD